MDRHGGQRIQEPGGKTFCRLDALAKKRLGGQRNAFFEFAYRRGGISVYLQRLRRAQTQFPLPYLHGFFLYHSGNRQPGAGQDTPQDRRHSDTPQGKFGPSQFLQRQRRRIGARPVLPRQPPSAEKRHGTAVLCPKLRCARHRGHQPYRHALPHYRAGDQA